MQMRLAFAVAAHLEPEILFVDEVLAVGDIEFQKKCLGKMQEVSRSGRTIVFVSHQMNQIRRLCDHCIWIDGGQIRSRGPMLQVVSAYEASFSASPASLRGPGSTEATRFVSWRILEQADEESNAVLGFDSVAFEFVLEVDRDIREGVHGVALFNSDQQLIWATSVNKLALGSGTHSLRFRLPSLPLKPGVYHWQVSIWEGGHCFDQWTGVPNMIVGTKPVTHPQEDWQGLLNIPWEFEAEALGSSATRQEPKFEKRGAN